MANTLIIDVTTRCKAHSEYDTQPASESNRLQLDGDDMNYIDLGLRGSHFVDKIKKGVRYQVTITEITN